MTGKAKEVSKIDKYIGHKINDLRVLSGLSQQELAAKIGVTYQQAHKYEKGINRISAGRLASIADALGVPVSYFFEGYEEQAGHPKPQPAATGSQRAELEITRRFRAIKNPQHREAVSHLIRVLSEDS